MYDTVEDKQNNTRQCLSNLKVSKPMLCGFLINTDFFIEAIL